MKKESFIIMVTPTAQEIADKMLAKFGPQLRSYIESMLKLAETDSLSIDSMEEMWRQFNVFISSSISDLNIDIIRSIEPKLVQEKKGIFNERSDS
jgi:hypothetical protein